MEYFKKILTSQFEATLSMFKQRIEICPAEYWEGQVATDTFRQVAYHALFYFELYLSYEKSFQLSELHIKGGDDRQAGLCPGLSKEDTLQLIERCRQKISESLATETKESLEGESGFSWRKFSRGELHIYNIRHFQHHVGQLSTYLRRISNEHALDLKLNWVGEGWK
jgi:hypothetical protein